MCQQAKNAPFVLVMLEGSRFAADPDAVRYREVNTEIGTKGCRVLISGSNQIASVDVGPYFRLVDREINTNPFRILSKQCASVGLNLWLSLRLSLDLLLCFLMLCASGCGTKCS